MKRKRSSFGFSIIEMLACMSILTMIFCMAGVTHYHYSRYSRGLIRNVDDITAAITVGERWRKDLRSATAPLSIDKGILKIPQRHGTVLYSFIDGTVQKKREADKKWWTVLKNVQASTMLQDRRKHAACWRWELELKTRAKEARVRPLFTFQAVPVCKNRRIKQGEQR